MILTFLDQFAVIHTADFYNCTEVLIWINVIKITLKKIILLQLGKTEKRKLLSQWDNEMK